MMGTLRETAKESAPHGRRAGSTRRAAQGHATGRRALRIGFDAARRAHSGQGRQEGTGQGREEGTGQGREGSQSDQGHEGDDEEGGKEGTAPAPKPLSPPPPKPSLEPPTLAETNGETPFGAADETAAHARQAVDTAGDSLAGGISRVPGTGAAVPIAVALAVALLAILVIRRLLSDD